MVEPQLFPNQPDPEAHVAQHKGSETPLQPVATRINDVATRLKILEERYNTLRKKSQLTEQNIIESDKNNFNELRLMQENLLEVKKSVKNLTEKLSLLTDEIKTFASKNEFTILQRYVDFWQPMDFATRKDVNDFLIKKFKK